MAGVLSRGAGGAPLAKSRRLIGKTSPFYVSLLEELGAENPCAKQMVYLVTVSRVLPGVAATAGYRDLSTLTGAELVEMIKGSFENPLVVASAPGRPRASDEPLVLLVVVAKESHADGTIRSHAAMKLSREMRFKMAKLTLEKRHALPSHWSCTHTQLWTTLRYLHVGTPKKPIVDTEPAQWTLDGRFLDLTELSQEPFMAKSWRLRREKAEAKAIVEETPAPNFNKLDFIAFVLSKHLHTKASLLAHVQDYASPAAKLFVSKHQRRLVEYIEDAQEWAEAKAAAGFEKMSDWEVLCKAGGTACPHAPGECSYARAVDEIFRVNAATLCQRKLARNLKDIVKNGPSKTCRVPMLVGPSNTGKSTVLYPFDDLFGPKQVFHKPALGSSFALRNIVQKKRFIFWDDYRPVEYAQEKTVPVAAYLSLFIGKHTEVQVSQSFHDGNLDVQWNRGVVFTAKEEGLWTATPKVPAEDIRHLRNRVEEYPFRSIVPELKEVVSCAPCMARWILKFSDLSSAPGPAAVSVASAPAALPAMDFSCVSGFADLMEAARLTGPVVGELLSDVLALGAVDVKELRLDDWQRLPAWSKLRPMEVRRLVAAIP